MLFSVCSWRGTEWLLGVKWEHDDGISRWVSCSSFFLCLRINNQCGNAKTERKHQVINRQILVHLSEPCGGSGIAYRIGCVAFCNGPPYPRRTVALPIGYGCWVRRTKFRITLLELVGFCFQLDYASSFLMDYYFFCWIISFFFYCLLPLHAFFDQIVQFDTYVFDALTRRAIDVVATKWVRLLFFTDNLWTWQMRSIWLAAVLPSELEVSFHALTSSSRWSDDAQYCERRARANCSLLDRKKALHELSSRSRRWPFSEAINIREEMTNAALSQHTDQGTHARPLEVSSSVFRFFHHEFGNWENWTYYIQRSTLKLQHWEQARSNVLRQFYDNFIFIYSSKMQSSHFLQCQSSYFLHK